ncbi:flagellar hook-associated protein FlgK [Carnobacteriaceae bacterium 52-44]
MTGLFGTLNTSTSGMRAQQHALQTTSHNLANSNTVGYSRQRVTMAANMPQSLAGIGQIGTGVVIDGITRITDDFVNTQLQNEEASLNRYQQLSDVLGQLEAMFNEPSSTGISHQMSEFFNSWNNLASNPESLTSKTMVVRQAETFLDTVNHTLNKMNELSGDTLTQIDKQILDFNSAVSQLKGINDQIFNATVKGEMPNDLLDKRDMLVGQMKNIAGVKTSTDKYGRTFIKLDGQEVVSENTVNKLEMTGDEDNTVSVVTEEGTQPVEIKTGAIKGLQEALVVVDEKRAEVSGFIENLVLAVNTIHQGGEDGEGIEFFTVAENGKISVNQDLINDPSKLNVGKEFGEDAVAGDGTRAKAIFDLQNTMLSLNSDDWTYDESTMSFESSASGSTLFNQYNEVVTDMGITKQQADNMVANQLDLTILLEQRRDSISGVDINEEVVNMIQYQSAFQANARAISTISEMLDTLINRMGV